MNTILVTGANGYIGSHLVKYLCSDGFHVIATDLINTNIDPRADFVAYDIFSFPISTELYHYFKCPSICIHLAWSDGFNHDSLNHLINMAKHFTFLKQLIDGGLNHLLVAGSFREYGCIDGVVSEDMSEVADNFYSLGKITLKNALILYLKNKNACFQWIRPFSVYGGDHLSGSLFGKILLWEKEGKKTFPFTDGVEEYDYIHIDELTAQIKAIISQKKITGIINCCSGKTIKLKDKVENFLRQHNLKIRPDYHAFLPRTYDSKFIAGDNKKIQKIMSGLLEK